MQTGALREILAADVAVELGVLTAAQAGAAFTRGEGVLATLGGDDRAKVEAEVARILGEAGGDVQAAVQKRGVDREIPASLAPAASHALSEAGARLRAPLRAMDKKRYVGFLPLGEGGMGIVYLALDSELNRRVAFKMIRAGVTDPLADESGPVADDMVARFMQEAVVTGGLEHPGIVPVYELGITPSGAPYYTMRLVRGERTLDHGIKEATTIEDRLALLEPFLKICDAVEYAHSRGVIHRDLKPANIALGQFGEVVVLDWGLAKMHERPDLAGSRWQTRLTELRDTTDLKTLTSALGTPGYMAPEAALGEIDKIDKRADVYSLGAILHRILTGEFPFTFSTFPEYIAKLTEGITEIPTPLGLGRICVRALASRRDDRFGGVQELADAIRHWQNESSIDREVDALQVEADSALKTAEGLAGDAQLSQLDRAMAVAVRILDLRPGHERAEAIGTRARALRADAIAQREVAARKRLLKRVGIVGLVTATAATVVVAVLLNSKREEADEARARAEDLAGFMLHDLHDGLVPIGRLDLLKKVALKSLDHYTSMPSEDITDKERLARALVLRRIGRVLRDGGETEAALKSTLQSLRLYKRLGDQYEISHSLNILGDIQQEANDLDGALESYRRSAAIRRELGREQELCRSIDRVAEVLMRRGERAPAVKLYAESHAIRRRLHEADRDDPQRQEELALSLQQQGQLAISELATALKFFEEALSFRRRLLEATPADAGLKADLAGCLYRVAWVRMDLGDSDGAKRGYLEALALYKSLTEADPANIWHQRDYAMTLERLGRYSEALRVKRAVVERAPKNQRARHDVVVALINMAEQAKAKKDYDGAMERLQEGLSIARKLAAEDASNTEWQRDLYSVLYRVGDIYLATKRPVEAQKKHVESLEVAKALADKDPENGDWQRNYALALDRLGDYEESLEIRRALYKRDPKNVVWQRDLVWGLGRMGNKTKNPEFYEEAAPVHRGLPKSETQQRDLAFCLYMIGTLREGRDELETALPALREAWQVHSALKAYANERQWWADAYFRVNYNAACDAARAGKRALALKLLTESVTWSRANLAQPQRDAHLEHARRKDPDLQSLRGAEEFEALFR